MKTIIGVFCIAGVLLFLGWGTHQLFFTTDTIPTQLNAEPATPPEASLTTSEGTVVMGPAESRSQDEPPYPKVEINFNLNQVLQENGTRKDILGADQRSTGPEGVSLSTIASAVTLAGLAVLVFLWFGKRSG